jgi:hypothetical protein
VYEIQEWTYAVHYRLRGLVRSLKTPFPVVKLSGRTERSGPSASTIVAARQPRSAYLANLVFADSPEHALLDSVSLCALPRTLDRLTPSVELVMARVDTLSARLLFDANYLYTPQWVELWLKMPQNLKSLTTGYHKKGLRNDLRRVARNRLTCELSHSEADLEDFYRNFYAPYARQRFGKYAQFVDLRVFRRRYKRGGLFWALQNGKRVAGANFVHRPGVLRLEASGALDGDPNIVESGAFVALYWAQIQHAHALGCKAVNFGGSRGILTDGPLRYKRKFGARIVDRGYTSQWLIRWQKLNPSILALLAKAPLVFRERGHLSAVSVLDVAAPASRDEVAQAHRFLYTPGLYNLHLLSAAGFADDVIAPSQTCLTDLNTLGTENLAALLTSGALAERSA